jgi:hypothetical protein
MDQKSAERCERAGEALLEQIDLTEKQLKEIERDAKAELKAIEADLKRVLAKTASAYKKSIAQVDKAFEKWESLTLELDEDDEFGPRISPTKVSEDLDLEADYDASEAFGESLPEAFETLRGWIAHDQLDTPLRDLAELIEFSRQKASEYVPEEDEAEEEDDEEPEEDEDDEEE